MPAPAAPLPALPESFDSCLGYLHTEDTPGPGPFRTLTQAGLRLLAVETGQTLKEAMLFALEHEVWPLRFKANRGIFTAGEQAALLRGRVAVIGCGGLGGALILLLSRLGVGSLTVCDADVFAESNLNRQLLSREDRLGRNKALCAQEELALVASHVEIAVWPVMADAQNLPRILEGAAVAADCLDNLPDRRLVEQAARQAGIPFAHAAIAGLEGFALSVPAPHKLITGKADSGSRLGGLSALYGKENIENTHSAEYTLGVPTPTPVAAAVLQCMQITSALLHTPGEANSQLWHLDLSAPSLEAFKI